MKQVELNLQKRLLILEIDESLETLEIFSWNNQPLKKICEGSELIEEIAEDFVLKTSDNFFANYKKYVKQYGYPMMLSSALDSFISAIESKNMFWDKNDLTDSIEAPDIDEWKEAESRTFNPDKTLIFEIL